MMQIENHSLYYAEKYRYSINNNSTVILYEEISLYKFSKRAR